MARYGNRLGAAWIAPLLAVIVLVVLLPACSGAGKRPAASSVTPAVATSAVPVATVTPAAPPTGTAVPLAPHEALLAAREALREGRHDVAAARFGAMVASSGGTLRAEAGIGLSLARFEEGDRAGAIDALRDAVASAPGGSPEGMRARYLLGLRLNEAGQPKEAAAVLQEVMSRSTGGTLQPYIAAEYARGLSAGGDAARGDAAWDSLLAGSLSPVLRTEVLKARCDAARAAGDTSALARWLDQRISTGVDTSAMYERAQLALGTGDRERFAELLQGIVGSYSGAKEAVLAVADLAAAGLGVDAGQEGLVYYRRGAYAEARRVLLRAVAEPGLSSEMLAFRLYYLAAAYEDGGLPAEAVLYYDRAAAVGYSSYQHRARYWAARVTEGRGQASEAAARYSRLVADGPAGEFSGEAAFRAGYTLFAAGNLAAAVDQWALSGDAGGARAAYWTGRALAALGRVREAETQYQRAVDLAPLDFYALEAARALGRGPLVDVGYREQNLGRAVDWAVIERWLTTKIPGARPGLAPTAAGELMAVGLRKEAAAVLFDAARGAGAWRLLEIAQEAYRAGLVDVSAQLAVRIREAAGVPSHGVPGDLLRVAYPVDYVAQLGSQARIYGLDPLFLAALVRQESFWDPAAGSPAGALGLTQVIPPTGEGIARALGVAGFRPGDLFRPAVALRFGAYYLAGQIDRTGSPYYALSAYNAGPGNALRWIEATNSPNPADFVEHVEFAETQHYVAVVMEHYAHYLQAYSD